jgi:hypothetical protein
MQGREHIHEWSGLTGYRQQRTGSFALGRLCFGFLERIAVRLLGMRDRTMKHFPALP